MDIGSGVSLDLLEAMPDAVLLVGRGGAIEFANGQAAKLFGYDRAELAGMKLEVLVPEPLRAVHAEERRGYFRQPRVRPMGEGRDLTALDKGGREFPVEISLSVIETERGSLACSVVRDISERKRVEDELRRALEEVAKLRDRLAAENVYLREEVKEAHDFEDIVGGSAALRAVLGKVKQVSETDATVLLLGETGTGKELIAHAIHDRSRRSSRPLVKVNCAALPGGLIESELFGHERGAFTGAIARRPGRFELADGGTIFLDEVGELPLELQAKLLRVLQAGEFERLGSSRTSRVDVRVIAATNRDLEAAVAVGAFREDLYYRLGVFPIEMPPLRERREDIPLLVWYFINRKQAQLGRSIEDVPRRVMNALVAYDWPGNVRELENVVERAMILSHGPSLAMEESFRLLPLAVSSGVDDGSQRLSELERVHVTGVLEACDWKVKGKGNAAERLGLNPSTLRSRMKKLGIERPAGRRPM